MKNMQIQRSFVWLKMLQKPQFKLSENLWQNIENLEKILVLKTLNLNLMKIDS